MKKKLALIAVLFTMLSVLILKSGQPIKYMVINDGEIEWHTYSEENLI